MDIFLENTPDEHLAPLFAGVSADAVVCGHTHMQFCRTIGGTLVVNAGSVGMAYEDEPGAYWAMLGLDVELRRTPHDSARAEGTGFPGSTGAPGPTRAEAAAYFAKFAVCG
jgi:predicted phosphodiesterase